VKRVPLTRGRLPILVVLALCAVAVSSWAQPAGPAGKVYRVGHVTSGTPDQTAVFQLALEDGLRRLGYVEGQNLRFERRFADGRVERLPTLMAELVQLKVDAIVAGSNQTVALAKRATTTVPIVMTLAADPVGAGLVESLARPGGNVTGLAVDVSPDIVGKRLALLKEAAPAVARVAVVWEPALPESPSYWAAAQRAAAPLRLTLRPFELRQTADLDAAFERIAREGTDGLLVFLSPLTLRRAEDVTAFARRHRLPAIYGARIFAERGGLLSYGPDHADSYRRAATYLDRIFRGAAPADLPVEQPAKFELLVNLKTAKALSLTIPPSLLAQANGVVE
jgi:putative tryptophan/tyrosine transport system substrate-binding protein